jgi:hypothetical protein
MEIKAFIDSNLDLSIVLMAYSFLALIFITCFQYNVGGDGSSYISIAHYYATGNWNEAVNSYWSPLYSWLIAPFLLTGFDPFQAVVIPRALSLIAGFFTIIGVNQLAKVFKLDGLVKTVLLVSAVPMVLIFALMYATPDLLVTCILLFYFAVIFDSRYCESVSNGIFAGFFGALAYLAKSFVFPFFIVHFLFSNLFYYLKGKRKKSILKNLLFGFLIFFVISGLWIGALSQQCGEITIGTAKDYNHEIIGPTYQEHPVYFLGLIKPPTTDAISIWEDPSTVQLKDWSPFESEKYFEFQIKVLEKNVLRSIAFVENFSLFSVIIIIISSFLIFKSDIKRTKEDLTKLMMAIFIYIGGYSFIFVEPRYIWPVAFLLSLTGFYLLNYYYKRGTLNLGLRNVLLIMLMVSFMVTPFIQLASYVGSDNQIPVLSSTLKNEYQIQGNIASNDNWAGTLSISYYLQSKYFGLTMENTNSTSLEEELLSHNIDYYFVWGASDNLTLFNYKEITGNKINNLTIYSRRN